MGTEARLIICLIGLITLQHSVCTPVQNSISNTNLPKDLEQHRTDLQAVINQIYSSRSVSLQTQKSIDNQVLQFFDQIHEKQQNCMKIREQPQPFEKRPHSKLGIGLSLTNVTTSRPPLSPDPYGRSCGSNNGIQGKCVKSELCRTSDIITSSVPRSQSSDKSNRCDDNEVCCRESNDPPQTVARAQCGSRGECVPRGMCNPSQAYTHQSCGHGEECCPHHHNKHTEPQVNSCGTNRVCVDPCLCSMISDGSSLLNMPPSNCTAPQVCCRREDEVSTP